MPPPNRLFGQPPSSGNALVDWMQQNSGNDTVGPADPQMADAVSQNASDFMNWRAAQRAQSAAMGLMDPQTGLPTRAGLLDAAGQYGNALLMGNVAPQAAMLPEALASKTGLMYSAPNKPARPFSADYPGGASVDDAGRILTDIDGRPIADSAVVVGRRMAGARDDAITRPELDAVTEGSIGKGDTPVPPRALNGDSGRFIKRYDGDGNASYDIFINNQLPPSAAAHVYAHEAGHMLDELAGQIPTKGLSKELGFLYNDMNTNNPGRTRNLMGPANIGYSGEDVPREYMAEAIRAYLTNPNYIKTVAPNTAATIRAAVNAHPQLSKIIQFNSAGGLVLGGAAAAQAGAPAEQQEPP